MPLREVMKKRNELLAPGIIAWLEKRHMEGYFCDSREEALELALSMMPEGSSVTWGGSQSIIELGLTEAFHKGNYTVYDRGLAKDQEELQEIYRKAFFADFYLASANALTEDGILINMDGNANRVAAISFGPKNVIFIVGMNKVVRNVEEGVSRIKSIAAPLNAQRLLYKTACLYAGVCRECLSEECMCCQLLITRMSRITGRIKVILVNDDLGY